MLPASLNILDQSLSSGQGASDNDNSAAPAQQNDLGYSGDVPKITARPQGQPVQMPNSINNLDDILSGKIKPAIQSTNNKTWKSDSILQNVGRAADVVRSAATEGVAAGNPLGLAINAPTMGMNIGARVIGEPIAYGVNLAMGNPNPWESAKATTNQALQDMTKYVPTTNSIVKAGAKALGAPIAEPGQVSGLTSAQPLPGEQMANAVVQGATGAPGLGQSAALGAGIMGTNEAIHQSPLQGTYAELPLQLATGVAQAKISQMRNAPKTTVQDPMNPGQQLQASDKQLNTATQDLMSRASDPKQAMQNLASQKNGGQLVEGAQPTMGEVADDVGLANAQKGLQTLYKEPFNLQEQTRQQALAAPLAKLTENGNVENLGAYARQTLEDQQNQNQQTLNIIEQTGNQSVAAAKSGSQSAMKELGDYGNEPTEGATGDIVLDAQKVRDQRASALYSVLDKVNNEPADLVTLRNEASKIVQQGAEYGNAPPGKTVQAVIDRVLNQPEGAQDTVKTLRNFQSQLSKAQRSLPLDERGDRALLTQLQGAANQGLENTVNGLSLRSEKFYNDMQQHINETKEQLYGNQQQQSASGNVSETSLQRPVKGTGKVLPGGSKAEGQASEQSGIDEGNKNLSSPSAGVTKEDVANVKGATRYYLQKSTLDEFDRMGIINSDGSLNSDKFAKWYASPDNRKMLQRNADFSEKLDKATNAQKSVEQAQAEAQTALDNARAKFKDEQKEVNDTAFSKYAQSASESSGDPTKVTSRIFNQGSIAARKQFYQLVQKVKGSPEALQSLKDNVSKHIYNWADVEKVKNKETGEVIGGNIGSPNALKDFVNNHSDALKIVYGDDKAPEILKNIADDIQRRQDYNKMTASAPGSDTTSNLAYSQRGAKQTVLGWLAEKAKSGAAGTGAIAGSFVGDKLGIGHAAGAFIGETIGSGLSKMNGVFSRSGLETIDKIQLAMMRDPTGFGLQMMQKFGGKQPSNAMLGNAAKAALTIDTIKPDQDKK